MLQSSHKIKFTKFFPVKSPLGINQKENKQQYPDVGIDIYFPEITDNFIEALKTSNKDLYVKIDGKQRGVNLDKKTRVYSFFKNKILVARYFERDEIFEIFENIQIPTGIGFLIPQGYYFDLRSKSSNFKNGYTSITGLIDENYTFSCGIQIVTITNEVIKLKINEKIAQLVLRKAELVTEFEEIDLLDFEKNQEVIDRRKNRVGGFGSTGKFDN